MKTKYISLLAATALLGSAKLASADLLLTDDFTTTQAVSLQPNFNIENRQTGSQSLSPYTISNNGTNSGNGVQLGNLVTNVGQPGFPNNGDFLLLADDYGVQNNLSLNDALVGGQPLNYTFDLYVASQGTDQTVWNAFSLRLPGNSFPIAQAGEFGMLRRASGGMQFFTNGAVIGNLDPGTSTSSLFSVTFSDLAGTGSPFAGNGSKVSVFNGGVSVFEYTFDTDNQLLSDGLEFGFNTERGAVGGVDNLSVSAGAVPEPATVSMLAMGGLVLVQAARRRLRTP